MVCYQDNYSFYISFDGGGAFNPVQATGVKLSYSREKDQKFVRPKSGEWTVRRRGNEGVYDALLALMADPAHVTVEVQVRIAVNYPAYNTHSAYSFYEYYGHINLTGMSIDEDNGIIKFTPDTDDDYSFWDRYKDEKIDILKDQTAYTITFNPYRRLTALYYAWDPVTPALSPPSKFKDCTSAGFVPQTYDATKVYHPTATEDGWCLYNLITYKAKTYCVGMQPDTHPGSWDAVISGIPPSTPLEIIINGAHTRRYWTYYCYHQYQLDVPASGWTEGSGIYDTGFPDTISPALGATNCDVKQYYLEDCSSPAVTTTVTEYGVRLLDVIQKMLDYYSPGLQITSQFFKSATNPYSGTPNTLLNLMLVPLELMYYAGANPDDVTPEMSMKELFDALRTMFNVYWWCDGNFIYLEHCKYFDYDHSYITPATPVCDLTDTTDFPSKYQVLTDINGNSNFKRYSFVNTSIPNQEAYHFFAGRSYDGLIKYTSKLAKDDEEKYDVPVIMTDVEYLFDYDDAPDSGYLMCICNSSNVIQLRTATMGVDRMDDGVGTSTTYRINGALFWSNLLNDWHLRGRYFEHGSIDNVSVDFESNKAFQKQTDIKFPRFFWFNQDLKVKSNLGDGEIHQMDIDLDTNSVTMTLHIHKPYTLY